MKKICVIIPVRGGSKRVPNKNLKLFNGKPMLSYVVEAARDAARESGRIDRVIVSSDSEEIMEQAKKYGADVPFKRPSDLAQDETPTLPVLRHCIEYLEEEDYEPDIIILAYATSPLVKKEWFLKIIDKIDEGSYQVMVVSKDLKHYWTKKENELLVRFYPKGMPLNSQWETPLYKEAGAIYATEKDIIMAENTLYGSDSEVDFVEIEEYGNIDVDTMFDFKIAEFIYQENQKEGVPQKIKVGNRWIGEGAPCFIIAEIGSNHNGSMETAKKMVDECVEAGVDAVKFQFFEADKIAADTKDPTAKLPDGRTLYEFYKTCETNRSWIKELAQYCKNKGVIFFATPFDVEVIDLLEEVDVPLYKVASFEIVDVTLLKKIAETGKPIIISSGMADLDEIKDALDVVYQVGNKDVAILHCGIDYPLNFEDVNLLAMKTIRDHFGVITGYSDHTSGISVPLAVVARGGKIIEKHFTLEKNQEGPDHSFALEPDELKAMVKGIRDTEAAIGSPQKKVQAAELIHYRRGRRSIFAKVDIPKGTTITGEMLTILRPGIGLKPKYLDTIVGRKSRIDIEAQEPITWDKI